MADTTWKLEKKSEFETQAEAFALLRAAGFSIRGEVRFKNSNASGRVDLLVLDDEGMPAVIIEVKRNRKRDRPEKMTGQILRYKTTGLPTIKIREKDLPGLVSLVSELL